MIEKNDTNNTNNTTNGSNDNNNRKTKIWLFLFAIKVVLVFAIMFHTITRVNWTWGHLLYSSISIGAAFILSQLFLRKLKIVGYILSSFLLFASLVNLVVLGVSGSFTTFIMWNNLANLEALGDALALYIAMMVGVLLVSFLPTHLSLLDGGTVSVEKNTFKMKFSLKWVGLLVVIFGLIIPFYRNETRVPLVAWNCLIQERVLFHEKAANLVVYPYTREEIYQRFWRDGVGSGIDTGLEQPNLIIFFAEGVGTEIFDIYNDLGLNLTPNLNAFAEQVLHFENYFSHTAATYRGIRGQLSSSFQFFEGFENGIQGTAALLDTEIISLQDILGERGYATTMVNPEPNLLRWTRYAEQLGFDYLISGTQQDWRNLFGRDILTDYNNFQLVYQEARRKNEENHPFFIVSYVLETHLGFESMATFGDGANNYLNKYHNLDNAFGHFWENFRSSPLYDNTIVIFTSDHPAFPTPEFQRTFQTNRTQFLGTIPLMIYYPGVQPAVIDVGGRNSISLAPTVLDIMGLAETPNYFLGNSLFVEEVSGFQFINFMGGEVVNTRNVTEEDMRYHQANIETDSILLDELRMFFKISLNYE